MEYTATWSEEYREYIGLATGFPSLSWIAPTQEDALRGIRSLVEETRRGMALDDCAFCLGQRAAERRYAYESNPFPKDYALSTPEGCESAYDSDHWLWETGYVIATDAGTPVRRTRGAR